ncbi:MAG: SDR family oxidoreductase, partial [Sphingomonadales bacterium]
MKIMVLGATGMLGSAVVRVMAEADHDVIAVTRSNDAARYFPEGINARFVGGLDAESPENLTGFFAEHRPELVINCVGLVKQLAGANRVLDAIPINTMLPHRLERLCAVAGARLVHISTDCVFSGKKGNYLESDASDAYDLYGVSKFLGEVDTPNAITLRTSIIGPQLNSAHSLLGWFLSQSGSVKGFNRAIFSGLPTVELARVIRDHVIPRPDLTGLYHVSTAPIDKYELLQLFAAEYGRDIQIVPDDSLVIDRSLDSTRFKEATGYQPAAWPE